MSNERTNNETGIAVGKRCRKLADMPSPEQLDTPFLLDSMAYLPDMDDLGCTVLDDVLDKAESFDFETVTESDVQRAIDSEQRTWQDFAALLSPVAAPFLEEMAQATRKERLRWFGTNVALFTPLYLANHCENHCVYCGFNKCNTIKRAKLDTDAIIAELDAIAATGLEEVLLLTGEDPVTSNVDYIAHACKLASERFKNVGVEVYPMNTEDYRKLHEAGVDYVTVFQETYDPTRYAQLHPAGRKRIFPYRFEAQERALKGGMRGVAFAALLGLTEPARDALATGLHAWYLQRAYPHAELSFSCPRLRPTFGANDYDNVEVTERYLLQILCAYRLFMPYAAITVSSRERAEFRNAVAGIAATKVSAGVSTGVGEHTQANDGEEGDDQFEIADDRDVDAMVAALRECGLEPVMNDHVLVD